jgi:hypothetical protein
MRTLRLKAVAALMAATLSACGGGGGGGPIAGTPPAPAPAPTPGPAPAPTQSPPVHTLGSSGTGVVASGTLSFNSSNGNLITVADAESPLLRTFLSVTAGTLRMASGSGAEVTGDNSGSVRVEGSSEQINAALNGMVYTAPGSVQTVTLEIVTQDASTPEPLSDSDQFTIAVVAAPPPGSQASPPVHTLSSGGATMIAGRSLTFNTSSGTRITVSDPDSTGFTMFVAVNAGRVRMASGSGATITGDNTGFVTVFGNLAQINAALDGMVYSAPATAQTVVLHVETWADGLNDHDSFTITVREGEFLTDQSAAVVWGQPGFTVRGTGEPTRTNLQSPQGRVAFHGALVYVPDTDHQRVLAFDAAAGTGPEATSVLGQEDFTSEVVQVNQDRLPRPASVATGGGRMAVVQQLTGRVSLWHTVPTSHTHLPTALLGELSWTSSGGGCGAADLNQPADAAIFPDGSKVVVADAENHRVNIYNFPAPGTLQPGLATVLGQNLTTHCEPNRNGTTPNAGTLHRPYGVWTNGTRLVVADRGNNRVLIWDTIPAAGASDTGRHAHRVLGQLNFETNLPNRGLSEPNRFTLNAPASVASDGTRLAVADTGNNRVLIWRNLASASNGAGADIVLGQDSFSGAAQNRGVAVPSEKSLATPMGVHFHEGKLYVTDGANNRILIYEPQ